MKEVLDIRRRLEEATAGLVTLFSKQGCASNFRTKAERDQYFHQETTSVNAFMKSQETVLQSMHEDVDDARKSQQEITTFIVDSQEKMKDGKKKAKYIHETVLTLKA